MGKGETLKLLEDLKQKTMSEKYFVFAMKEDGGIEPVIWFETLKEARKEAKDWKKRFPSDKPIYIGKLLFEPKEKEVKP